MFLKTVKGFLNALERFLKGLKMAFGRVFERPLIQIWSLVNKWPYKALFIGAPNAKLI